MEKRSVFCIFVIFVITCSVVTLCACDLFGSNSSGDLDSTQYTIMYADENGTHEIKVKDGELYKISEPIPQKKGYDFAGFYDSEIGGTQYISASGLSLAPFTDKRNIVLYPRYIAKEYTLVLDYGEANQTGLGEIKVNFGDTMPYFPAQLSIKDEYYMVFVGWYTKGNSWYGNELQLADSAGKPLMNFDNSLLELCDSNRILNVYARFELAKYTVNFFATNGDLISKKTISHGENLSSIAGGITHNGKKVLNWSQIPNGTAFKGIVEQDLNLYVLDYLVTCSVGLDLHNCADNNGYDIKHSASESDDRARHNNFKVVSLRASNVVKSADDYYSVHVKDYPISLTLNIESDINNLPINNKEAQLKKLSGDTFDGYVTNTNITGRKIGMGAYYVKVLYSDGSFDETNAVNIFNGKSKWSSIDLRMPNTVNKEVKQIEVSIVYEIYTGAPGVMGIWWHEYSNWRCDSTLVFK